MQQLENSATQNRLAQQQMAEGTALAPYRLAEAKAKSGSAELTLKQAQEAQEFVTTVMQKVAENHGGINDPLEAAQQMLLNPNPKVQEMGKHLAEAHQLVQGIRQQQAYAQGESSPNSFGVPARPAPGATPMPSQASAPVPLAPAAPGEAGTPVLTGNVLAPPSVNAMKPSADTVESIAAKIRKGNALYGNTPGWLNDRTLLVEQYKALLNPNQRTYAPIDASKYTPASLKAFNLSGDQSDLVPVTKTDKIESPFGKIDPDKFTPASLAKYAESNNFKDLVRAPKDKEAKDDPNTTAAFREVDNAGNVTFYNKFGNPISTQKGAGKPSATFEKTAVAKVNLARDLDQAIAELTAVTKDGGLIDQSTGSGVGRAVDIGARFIGKAMPGDIAIGKLQPVADLALKMVPRFEGPQSNADTTSYKQAAGQLADPTLPPEIRKAAGKTVLRLMIARKGQFTTADIPTEGAGAAPTGGDEWKVVK